MNGVPLHVYFDQKKDKINVIKSLVMANLLSKYNVWAVVDQGGKSAQSEAISVAVTRGK